MCKVYFIGAGPGDPELITLKGYRIIKRADVIIYAGSLIPKEVFKERRQDAKVIDSSSLNLYEIHEIIKEAVQDGKIVARLHTGDTSIYSAIREQVYLLEKDNIPYEIIPGVTSAFALAAKTNITFTIPERTQTLIITRVGGKTPVPEKEDLAELAKHNCSMAIYLSANMSEKIKNALLEGGFKETTPVIVGYKVSWPDEKIFITSIKDLDKEVKAHDIKRQALFLVVPDIDEEITFSKLYSPSFSHSFRR